MIVLFNEILIRNLMRLNLEPGFFIGFFCISYLASNISSGLKFGKKSVNLVSKCQLPS